MTAFPRATSHWLNIATMLADLAFETDIAGRFTAFGTSDVLGYEVNNLLGRSLGDLFVLRTDASVLRNDGFVLRTGGAIASTSFNAIFNTIYSRNAEWRGIVALQRADGSEGNYQLCLAPKRGVSAGAATSLNPAGGGGDGAYGLLIDLDAPELRALASNTEPGKAMLDPQTGLWSAATFATETARRFDRLDVEGLPGTLLLLGFSRTKPIGHNAVAIRLAEELRDIIRPTDLLGRLDATTFALWCDGMDDLTGAERAARFCQRLPAALPGEPCISVGLAARWPNKTEDVATLISQASAALRHSDRIAQAAADAGSTEPIAAGTWRAWNPSLPT
jgi:GGDEF domain-containing protein